MNGIVDDSGRVLVRILVKHPLSLAESEMDVWIDTGFTGELVLPTSKIKALGLPPGSAVKAVLADGKEIVLDTFTCQVDWFGNTKTIEVVANEGQYPLLGFGLLADRKLFVDYPKRTLTLE